MSTPAFPSTVTHPGLSITQLYFAHVVQGLLAGGGYGIDTTTDGIAPVTNALVQAAKELAEAMVAGGPQ